MAKTSIATETGQESSLREGLEAAIRDRVREIIEMVLQEEVEAALGAGRSQRVAERVGYRHGRKSRRLTLRTGTMQMQVPRARLVEREGGESELPCPACGTMISGDAIMCYACGHRMSSDEGRSAKKEAPQTVKKVLKKKII